MGCVFCVGNMHADAHTGDWLHRHLLPLPVLLCLTVGGESVANKPISDLIFLFFIIVLHFQEVLEKLLEPPISAHIDDAIQRLQDLGALDVSQVCIHFTIISSVNKMYICIKILVEDTVFAQSM